MRYRFDVSINDMDYLDFNIFSALKSRNGKAQMIRFRIFLAIVVLVPIVGLVINKDIEGLVRLSLMGVVLQLLLNPIIKLSVKSTLKTMKKKGKMPYTPESVLEFYDDHFVEIAPETRNEVKYSTVERVSVVEDKAIYIHVNSIMAYIVPFSCFARVEEATNFIEYLRAKCENIYFY